MEKNELISIESADEESKENERPRSMTVCRIFATPKCIKGLAAAFLLLFECDESSLQMPKQVIPTSAIETMTQPRGSGSKCRSQSVCRQFRKEILCSVLQSKRPPTASLFRGNRERLASSNSLMKIPKTTSQERAHTRPTLYLPSIL